MFSWQLFHQEHEQGADLWLVAVQERLVANLSFITNVLETNSLTYYGIEYR